MEDKSRIKLFTKKNKEANPSCLYYINSSYLNVQRVLLWGHHYWGIALAPWKKMFLLTPKLGSCGCLAAQLPFSFIHLELSLPGNLSSSIFPQEYDRQQAVPHMYRVHASVGCPRVVLTLSGWSSSGRGRLLLCLSLAPQGGARMAVVLPTFPQLQVRMTCLACSPQLQRSSPCLLHRPPLKAQTTVP